MGLFDYVIVECPIDGIEDPSSYEWQTKTFDDPFMEKYRITVDGRLLHEITHIEDHGDKTAPSGSIARAIGCMTPVHDGWEDTNYHGDVEFVGAPMGDWKYGVRMLARFTDGNLVRIAPVSDPNLFPWLRHLQGGDS